MQIMNEQAEIEFRLERMDQETGNESDDQGNQEMENEPEYMLATKYKAMISPLVRVFFPVEWIRILLVHVIAGKHQQWLPCGKYFHGGGRTNRAPCYGGTSPKEATA